MMKVSYMHAGIDVLQKLTSLKVAPGLGIFVSFRVTWDPNAERIRCAFVLVITVIGYSKKNDPIYNWFYDYNH